MLHDVEPCVTGLRRSAGLGDYFLYNNGQECSNFKYKSKIREKKMQKSTGYRPSMKCTWEEAIVIYKEMIEEVNREKQRAVIGKGRYQLASAYKHLEVSFLDWSSMTSSVKVNHIGKIEPSWKKAGVIPLSSESEDQCSADSTLGRFEDMGLLEFLRGSWKNACKIIEKQGIGPFPNDRNKMTVISLTSERNHTVQMHTNGKVTCDKNCPLYKNLKYVHTLLQLQASLLGSYQPPLEQMVSSSIPSGSGKKDNEKSRKRQRKDHSSRDVREYGEKVACGSQETEKEGSEPYELVFVKDTNATTCYGCKGKVRDKPSSAPRGES